MLPFLNSQQTDQNIWVFAALACVCLLCTLYSLCQWFLTREIRYFWMFSGTTALLVFFIWFSVIAFSPPA